MKKEIHPQVFNSTIHCVGCGFSFTCSTTVTDMRISVCSMCHPFYTGKQKLVDAEGRVDRFNRKYGKPSSRTEVPKEESSPAVDTAV